MWMESRNIKSTDNGTNDLIDANFRPPVQGGLRSIVRSFTASGQKLQIHIICDVSSILPYSAMIIAYQSNNQKSIAFFVEYCPKTFQKHSILHRRKTINKMPSWAVHHSDKLPENSVYTRHSALKMLEIHQVFLRFLP